MYIHIGYMYSCFVACVFIQIVYPHRSKSVRRNECVEQYIYGSFFYLLCQMGRALSKTERNVERIEMCIFEISFNLLQNLIQSVKFDADSKYCHLSISKKW